MKRITVSCLMLAFAAAGQPLARFAGVWERNKAESSPEKQPLDSMKVRIETQGEGFALTMRVVQRGKLEQMSNRYAPGQETKGEMHGVPLISHTEWDGAALVVHSLAKIMGKDLRLTDRFTLSADGNRLTMTERHQYGTEPEGEDTQVFDRRPVSTWEPDKPPALAEEVYKNIQVMKGLTADKVRTTMLNISAWLGVECAYCHVMGQFEKDEKPAKQTARAMFRMVQAINHDHFAASNAVTCWTCHQGSSKPKGPPAQ